MLLSQKNNQKQRQRHQKHKQIDIEIKIGAVIVGLQGIGNQNQNTNMHGGEEFVSKAMGRLLQIKMPPSNPKHKRQNQKKDIKKSRDENLHKIHTHKREKAQMHDLIEAKLDSIDEIALRKAHEQKPDKQKH